MKKKAKQLRNSEHESEKWKPSKRNQATEVKNEQTEHGKGELGFHCFYLKFWSADCEELCFWFWVFGEELIAGVWGFLVGDGSDRRTVDVTR